MISHTQHQRLCRARQRLEETDSFAWPLERVADEAGLSRYQFIRRFADLFGETPHQYRQRHRLRLAWEMLLIGDQSVTEICFAVGFSSLGSFSSLFKRYYGRTPKEFRKRSSSEDSLRYQPGCISLMQQAWRS